MGYKWIVDRDILRLAKNNISSTYHPNYLSDEARIPNLLSDVNSKHQTSIN